MVKFGACLLLCTLGGTLGAQTEGNVTPASTENKAEPPHVPAEIYVEHNGQMYLLDEAATWPPTTAQAGFQDSARTQAFMFNPTVNSCVSTFAMSGPALCAWVESNVPNICQFLGQAADLSFTGNMVTAQCDGWGAIPDGGDGTIPSHGVKYSCHYECL